MSWDGGGTFNRVHNFSADASAGIQAQAARFDAEFDAYKTGLENCQTLTGETTPTGNSPMGGNRHTGVGAAVSVDNYLRADQNSKQTGIFVVGTSVTGQTMTASVSVFPATLVDGMRICATGVSLSGGSTSTSAVTIIINNLTAEVANHIGAIPVSEQVVRTNEFRDLVYSSASGKWVMMEQTEIKVSANVVFAIENVSAGTRYGSTSAPMLFVRNGSQTTWKMETSLSISASTSATRLFVRQVPKFANGRDGTSFQVTEYGSIRLRHASSGAISWLFCRADEQDSANIELRSINPVADISGPGITIQPFNFTFTA